MPHDAWPILAPICIIHFYYNFIVHAHKKRTIEKMIVPWIYLMRHKMIKAYNENNIGKCCHKIILQTFMEAILKSLIYCPNNLIRITSSTSWRHILSTSSFSMVALIHSFTRVVCHFTTTCLVARSCLNVF